MNSMKDLDGTQNKAATEFFSPMDAETGFGGSKPNGLLRLLYIIPVFPWRGNVFEQNELMGLLKVGVPLRIFSCRWVNVATEMNEFARPLLEFTEYFDWRCAIAGLARAIRNRPAALIKILLLTLRGCLNPLFAPRVLGAFLYTLHLYRTSAGRFDWVHADFGGNSASVGLFLSIMTSTRFSYKVHAYDIYSRSLHILDPLRRIKARAAQIILSEHADGKKAYCDQTKVSPHKVFVHYSCVRADVLTPAQESAKPEQVLALGRLVKKKGFDVLIRAVADLQSKGVHVSVKINGCGPEKKRIEALINLLHLRDSVELGGAYDNDQLVSMLAGAGMLVMPSVIDGSGDRDGVPTVIYEAMACGVPVIASAIGGIPEVVCDARNGLLVEPGNVQDLALAINRMISDTALRRQLGEQARRDILERYDYRDAAERMRVAFNKYFVDSNSTP
jgi:glycosyltransferase involved in cell wall biosynthesis